MDKNNLRVVVVGNGIWARVLAQVLLDNYINVSIYEIHANDININHSGNNKAVMVTSNVVSTNDIRIINEASIIILAVPVLAIEEVCLHLTSHIISKVIVVNVAKGFNPHTNERISDTIRRIIPDCLLSSVVSLIGPSHAEEVALRMLTTVSAVSLVESDARAIQSIFSNEYFRVYTSSDEIGSEFGVAVKNVIAIASGMISGLGYGDNARAALITRGLVEITKIVEYVGGKKETMMGLTGIGDLIVTCTSGYSRNFKAGLFIGENDGSQDFLSTDYSTVEGICTVKNLYELFGTINIDLPIITEVYNVLYQGERPSQSAAKLMKIKLKPENEN